jgi:hypothetical protein
MPLSVRLDKKTETLLHKTASILHTTKTEVIKESLSEYCARVLSENQMRPYDLLKDLLDRGGSGRRDLSSRGEEILRKKFRRKR